MCSTRFGSSAPMCCLLALGLNGCGGSVETIDGECGSLYDGEVCTWATLSGDEVVEFGATVPVRAIESAPLDLEMVWPPQPIAIIPLPEEVTQAIGFNHLMINWEHHGHPPALSVPGVGANVAWPSRFEAVYDESTQTYRFTYSGFGGD